MLHFRVHVTLPAPPPRPADQARVLWPARPASMPARPLGGGVRAHCALCAMDLWAGNHLMLLGAGVGTRCAPFLCQQVHPYLLLRAGVRCSPFSGVQVRPCSPLCRCWAGVCGSVCNSLGVGARSLLRAPTSCCLACLPAVPAPDAGGVSWQLVHGCFDRARPAVALALPAAGRAAGSGRGSPLLTVRARPVGLWPLVVFFFALWCGCGSHLFSPASVELWLCRWATAWVREPTLLYKHACSSVQSTGVGAQCALNTVLFRCCVWVWEHVALPSSASECVQGGGGRTGTGVPGVEQRAALLRACDPTCPPRGAQGDSPQGLSVITISEDEEGGGVYEHSSESGDEPPVNEYEAFLARFLSPKRRKGDA